jgi:glutamine amidotransferase
MTTQPAVALVDYGAGNFASVRVALEHIDAEVFAVRTREELDRATHVVLPGVGAYAACMRRLEATGLVEPLRELIAADQKPFLGICVGMQLLAEMGREFEDYPGLGAIPGEVRRIDAAARAGLRLPHIGWNALHLRADTPLFEGLGETPHFYFVHSYAMEAEDPSAVVATVDYGADVAAVVARGQTFGVQFHPEKSQRAGLKLLENFVRLPSGARSRDNGAR